MIWGYHYFWKHPCTLMHCTFNKSPHLWRWHSQSLGALWPVVMSDPSDPHIWLVNPTLPNYINYINYINYLQIASLSNWKKHVESLMVIQNPEFPKRFELSIRHLHQWMSFQPSIIGMTGAQRCGRICISFAKFPAFPRPFSSWEVSPSALLGYNWAIWNVDLSHLFTAITSEKSSKEII